MAEGHEAESVALDELERRLDRLREQCAEASAEWQRVVPVVTAAAVRLGAVGQEYPTSRGDAVSEAEADRGLVKAIADMVSAVGLVLSASELVIKLGPAGEVRGARESERHADSRMLDASVAEGSDPKADKSGRRKWIVLEELPSDYESYGKLVTERVGGRFGGQGAAAMLDGGKSWLRNK